MGVRRRRRVASLAALSRWRRRCSPEPRRRRAVVVARRRRVAGGARTDLPDSVRQVSTVADVVAALDGLYDPARAEAWDAVGLVCGDPEAEVRRAFRSIR